MKSANRRRLAERLRSARLAAGLTLRQAEAQSGVSKSIISRLEREGIGSAQALLALGRALELPARSLFTDAGRKLPRRPSNLPAMLRAEYDLPPEAIKQIQQNIEQIARQYRRNDYE